MKWISAAVLGLVAFGAVAAEPAVDATMRADGTTELAADGTVFARLKPFAFARGWQLRAAAQDRTVTPPADAFSRALAIDDLAVAMNAKPAADGRSAVYTVTFTARADAFFEGAGVMAELPSAIAAGGSSTVGEVEVALPDKFEKGKNQLHWANAAKRLSVSPKSAPAFALATENDRPMGIGDNREWNQALFVAQIQLGGAKAWKAGEARALTFTLESPAGFAFVDDRPEAPKPLVSEVDAKPMTVRVAPDGVLHFQGEDGKTAANFHVYGFAPGWQYKIAGGGGAAEAGADGEITRTLVLNGAVNVAVAIAPGADGRSADLRLRYTATKDTRLHNAGVAFRLPSAEAAGMTLIADEKTVLLPEKFENDRFDLGTLRGVVALGVPGKNLGLVVLRPAKPMTVAVGDNRKWNDRQFPVRVQLDGAEAWKAGETRDLALKLEFAAPVAFTDDRPPVVTAGADWAVLPATDLEIVPGSALDFTNAPWRHAPAGKFGPVEVADGKFVFKNDPDRTPRRFYGTNLCYDANYLPGDEPDRLAKRLAAIGYNAVRLHHTEEPASWANPRLIGHNPADTTDFNADALERLDRMFAALKREGLYVTTDLLMNARGPRGAVWPDHPKPNGMFNLRAAVPVNDRAFELWAAFTHKLLTHQNPHTGLTWGEDPALIALSLINEGNMGNHPHMDSVKNDAFLRADWNRAWNPWLAERAAKADGLVEKAALPGDPAQNTADIKDAMGVNVYWIDNDKSAARLALLREFLAVVEAKAYVKMRDYLHGLGIKTPTTNTNGWTNDPMGPLMRADYDYVDDHFYIDTPDHRQKPRRFQNQDPVATGLLGGLNNAWLRIAGKPFTITEFNAGNPSRYRGFVGVGSVAFAALQDWDGLYRFAYSHGRLDSEGTRALFEPMPIQHTLDLSQDPLQLATERAALCLFLRRDIAPAKAALLVRGTADEFAAVSARRGQFYREDGGNNKRHQLLQPAHPTAKWAAAGARVAQLLESPAADAAARAFAPDAANTVTATPAEAYAFDGEPALLEKLAAHGWPEAAKTAGNPDKGKHVDLPGFLLDPEAKFLRIDTPRTVAAVGHDGLALAGEHGAVELGGAWAVAWASSIDGEAPLANAKRILVQHLTDVLATNTTFSDHRMNAVADDGEMPWLARAGTATVTIRRAADAPRLRAWALDFNGRRHEEIPVETNERALVLSLKVHGRDGANLAYELAVE